MGAEVGGSLQCSCFTAFWSKNPIADMSIRNDGMSKHVKMIFLKTPNLWGELAHLDGALGVVRGVENLRSQVVCLCMVVFVYVFVCVETNWKKVCGLKCECGWVGGGSCLASTILMGPLRLLGELWPLFSSSYSRVVVVQTLCHPLTDDVHKPLEGLLHINVIFSTRFKVLKTCQEGWQRQKEAVVTLIVPRRSLSS